MKFFSSKQKSTFVIYGGLITFHFFYFCPNDQAIFVLQLYICMVLTQVDFRNYRNKPARLHALDHVEIITTELTLVIIGIEMLFKGAE